MDIQKIMKRREQEILEEKKRLYAANPNWGRHGELVHVWGEMCDCDVCGGTTGEPPMSAMKDY